jgi:hypothetical protein
MFHHLTVPHQSLRKKIGTLLHINSNYALHISPWLYTSQLLLGTNCIYNYRTNITTELPTAAHNSLSLPTTTSNSPTTTHLFSTPPVQSMAKDQC